LETEGQGWHTFFLIDPDCVKAVNVHPGMLGGVRIGDSSSGGKKGAGYQQKTPQKPM